MTDQQERDLAAGLRAGRAEAWHALYDAYAVAIWRAVARLMGPQAADVADVVQETFLAAARSAATYDPNRGSLWMWLGGIARRHVALAYRRQGQRQRLVDNAGARCGAEANLADGLEPLLTEERRALIRQTLLELPPDYELLLTAYYLDGVAVEDLAIQQRSTLTAIRSKLARARQAFRQSFEQYAEYITIPTD